INMISHVATADALLNLILTATLLLMYHNSQLSLVQPESPGTRQVLYGIYALMALGVLTKGPVAVAIPLVVSVIFYLWSGQRTA
ncbi:hypothetical protein Q8W27_17020, partial [Oceanobacter sp. 2_MG-2023]|uniref:hypothetical protein n=1 Tax=Oceanobacter sp. 2_MG-2023 TaxID=3062619 RepID=UPI0027351683